MVIGSVTPTASAKARPWADAKRAPMSRTTNNFFIFYLSFFFLIAHLEGVVPKSFYPPITHGRDDLITHQEKD